MQVTYVAYDITPTVKQITHKADYDKVQLLVYNLHGLVLEPYDELDIQYKDSMVVFMEPWKVKIGLIHNKKQYCVSYEFDPGFISDKGSVPKYLRSIVDNDDGDFLMSFYIHDANYKCHFMTRGESDDLLREMAKYYGAGIIRRNAVYQAVNWFGKSAYNSGIKAIEKQRKFVKYSCKRV